MLGSVWGPRAGSSNTCSERVWNLALGGEWATDVWEKQSKGQYHSFL
jgi:hypothetical protein